MSILENLFSSFQSVIGNGSKKDEIERLQAELSSTKAEMEKIRVVAYQTINEEKKAKAELEKAKTEIARLKAEVAKAKSETEKAKEEAKKAKAKAGGSNAKSNAPTFKTVKIGSQVWTAENIALTKDRDGNELVLGKDYRYTGNDEKNVKTFGLVYTWSAAMRIAPKGWHLPSDEEWKEMEKKIGMCDTDIDIHSCDLPRGVNIVHKLCCKNQWKVWDKEKGAYVGEYPSEHDSNSTGFSALPCASYGSRDGVQDTLSSSEAHYWSSTGEEDKDIGSLLGETYYHAYYRGLSIRSGIQRGLAGGGLLSSVRLIKDED